MSKIIDAYPDLEVRGISPLHSKVHSGFMWAVRALLEAVAATTTKYFTFVTPAGFDVHCRIGIDASLPVKFAWYEAASGISGGSAYSPWKYRRLGATPDASPPMTGAADATVTTPGTALFTDKVLGAGNPVGNGAITFLADEEEIILAPSKTYVLGVTTGAAITDIRVLVDFYIKKALLTN